MAAIQQRLGNRGVRTLLQRDPDDTSASIGVQVEEVASTVNAGVESAAGVASDVLGGVVDAVEGVIDGAGDVAVEVAGAGNPMLRQGNRGPSVERLQALLNDRGAALVVDGDFGPRTNDAVLDFQRDQGIDVDGIVGPVTWGELIVGRRADAEPGRRRRSAFEASSAQDQADWQLLGGTAQQWNDGDAPGLQAGTSFDDLTDPQKAAAVRLGYSEESWNLGREATADEAQTEYQDEEAEADAISNGALPDQWAGSLRSRAILQAEFGDYGDIDLPRVVLLNEAQTEATYEGFYGAGSYTGLEGFARDGTIYLNTESQSTDTVIHEVLHIQEHPDWDGIAYTGGENWGEGATELLTLRAASRYEVPTSQSYPDHHATVRKMNTHSSEDQMIRAYFQGGAEVTTYQAEVTAGLVAGTTFEQFQAATRAGLWSAAQAMLQ